MVCLVLPGSVYATFSEDGPVIDHMEAVLVIIRELIGNQGKFLNNFNRQKGDNSYKWGVELLYYQKIA